MAMTKCKECGTELSTKADACPKCGARVRRTSLVTKIVAGLIALGVAFSIFSAYQSSRDRDAAAAQEAARRAQLSDEQRKAEDAKRAAAAKAEAERKAVADAEWKAVQACQAGIMSVAKWHDPGSVEWPQLSRSYRELKAGAYTVQIDVRAKNAFNALILQTFECKVRATDFMPTSVKPLR